MNYQNEGLLLTLKKQIDKLDLLVKNFDGVKTHKMYEKNPLVNLFNTRSEKLTDFTDELNTDYQELKNFKIHDIKIYNIEKLGQKIEALYKYVSFIKKSLAKKSFNHSISSNSNSLDSESQKQSISKSEGKKQLHLQSLENRKTLLLGMLKKINSAIDSNLILQNNNSNNNIDIPNNKEQLIKLKNKKTEIEKELFSITKQL